MRVVIAGGTGFIGKQLVSYLLERGDEVIILTRKAQPPSQNVTYVRWLHENDSPEKEIQFADAVINLAGVSLNDGRWTKKQRQAIYSSRIQATEALFQIISKLQQKPSVYLQASAIGIYPPSETNIYTEQSTEQASDFLGKTVANWEAKAKQIEGLNIRTVLLRFGVVLGQKEGAFPLLVLPYRLFVGGKIGSGQQWISWVHIVDVVRTILFVLDTELINGPVNVTAPFPKRNKDAGKAMATVLKRPHWLPIPSTFLKIALGQKSTLVLDGQHVLPEKLQQYQFEFSFPTFESAVQDLSRM